MNIEIKFPTDWEQLQIIAWLNDKNLLASYFDALTNTVTVRVHPQLNPKYYPKPCTE